MLGSRNGVSSRRIDDEYPARGGRGHVDVVHAYPGAANHLEPFPSLDDFPSDLGFTSYHQRVVVGEARQQVRASLPGDDVDFGLGLQPFDALPGDGVGNKNSQVSPLSILGYLRSLPLRYVIG